jgi:hypothetical protein
MDHHKRCDHSDGWLEFEKMLYWKNGDRPQNVALILEMYGQLARKGRDNISEEKAKNVMDLVELAGREITKSFGSGLCEDPPDRNKLIV